MKEQQYVNAIIRRVACGKDKKNEIKKQLLSDIALHKEQGEPLETILARMGSVEEIAASFNESISPAEQKQYIRNKRFKRIASVFLAIVLLAFLVYWKMPKGMEIADSDYFSQQQVEEAMKQTIEQLDAKDYAALQKNSIPEMQEILDEAEIEPIKQNISPDWGARRQFGPAYIAELVQGNAHFAVGEITVSYENTNVTYRLTYNADMQLAGLYIR